MNSKQTIQTKTLSIFILLTISMLFLNSCDQSQNKKQKNQTNESWQLIYKTNGQGAQIFGSKERLINLARKGYKLRLGWASRRKNDTTKSVEHTADAEFLTIANGEHIFVQIKPFFAQRPDLVSDTFSMTMLSSQSHWVLGTNGIISSVTVDHAKDTAISYPPSRFRYPLSWFVENPTKTNDNRPLWD